MKRIIHVLLIPLLTFILVGCLGEKLTEFKDCFPPVSLISTESTPTIEIINSRSDWDILKVASNNDYFVCIS